MEFGVALDFEVDTPHIEVVPHAVYDKRHLNAQGAQQTPSPSESADHTAAHLDAEGRLLAGHRAAQAGRRHHPAPRWVGGRLHPAVLLPLAAEFHAVCEPAVPLAVPLPGLPLPCADDYESQPASRCRRSSS